MTSLLPRVILAVADYVPSEIPTMREHGVEVFLLDEGALRAHNIDHNTLPSMGTPTEAMLRSPRLPHDTYQHLYDVLQRRNIRLVNTPEMVRRASEFELHYPLIEEATPRSIITSANTSVTDLYEEIIRKGLKVPLFVKTEIKSLKSGSVIKDLNVDALAEVLGNLRAQLSGFYRIIVREMVKLQPLTNHPDATLEYRAFVLHNRIVIVQDGTEGKPSPPVKETGGEAFFRKWVGKLAATNFSNFYIMDIALLAGGDDFVIIEIKDGQYTKIRDADAFWASS